MGLNQKKPGRFGVFHALGAMRTENMICRSPACGLLIVALLAGCQAGPSLYKTSFTEYNEAVRQTLDEQMLANLVRMRYYQSPIFLQVSSLNSSFSVGGNAGVSGTFVEGGADSYGANLGGTYSENPTITFSMPDSEKYYGRLLAPLSTKQVTSLVLAGFDSELVFRTSVRGFNGLRNLDADFDDSSEEPLAHVKFREALGLIKKLRAEGFVDLELGGKQTDWSSPITIDESSALSQVLLLGATSYAMSNDAEIVAYPDGKWQTHMYEKNMALRFSPASKDSADAQRLKKLLGLEIDRYNFPIVEAEMVNAEKARGVLGQPPGALDPSVVWSEIGLRGRSMLEIMQVASKEVQVPSEAIQRGIATSNRSQTHSSNTDASDWLVIKSSVDAPDNSSLKIQHKGYWYYIEDSDLQSRRTFSMLSAFFSVVGGTVPGAQPVMTIPVGL